MKTLFKSFKITLVFCVFFSVFYLDEEQVRAIVDKIVEKPLWGLFGTEKVNVLKLNIALEENSKYRR